MALANITGNILTDSGIATSSLVPNSRTLTINGVAYDLTANRSWTIEAGGTSASTRTIQKFTSTSNQTTFTITGGYTVGMVDVWVNGSKLDNAVDFTASNGTTVVLTDALTANQIVEVYKYGSQFIVNNGLRQKTLFTATAGQTSFTVAYSVGLVDVFYNGSKLDDSDFTATNGTSIVLGTACAVNDKVEVIAFSYNVNGFTGIGGSGTTNNLPKFTAAGTIGDSAITDNGTTVTLVSRALSGTSATFSGAITANGAYTNTSDVAIIVNAAIPAINLRTSGSIGRFTIASGYSNENRTSFIVGTGASNPSIEALKIEHSTGAATFSSSVTVGGGNNSGATFAINNGGAEAKQTFAGFSSNVNLTQSYNNSGAVYVTDEYRAASYIYKIGTTEAMRITSGGNVGIGTSIPDAFVSSSGFGNLVVGNGSGEKGITIYSGTTGRGGLMFADATSGSGAYIGYIIYNNSTDTMEFATSSVPRFFIKSDGRTWVGGAISGFDGSSAIFQVNGFSRTQQIILHNGANVAQQVSVSCNGAASFYVDGALSKNSGSFRIDHPLESMTETHQLVHSFVEAPQADLYYRGKLNLVNGKAQANIDEVATMTEGTFEALCREVQCFTTNETGWDLVKGKVIGNIIYIESQNTNSTDEISWLVIGERKDKHMMDTFWTDNNGRVIVEPLKPIKEEDNNKQ